MGENHSEERYFELPWGNVEGRAEKKRDKRSQGSCMLNLLGVCRIEGINGVSFDPLLSWGLAKGAEGRRGEIKRREGSGDFGTREKSQIAPRGLVYAATWTRSGQRRERRRKVKGQGTRDTEDEPRSWENGCSGKSSHSNFKRKEE